jgi:serine/threonine protein kinase
VITGTPAYFAPEVARGAEPTEASDVYSLGATVYTLVEGQPPFGVDDDSLALLHKVARARINPMTRAGAVEPVLLRLLEPSPSRRPTMAQARDLLAEVAAGERGSVRHVLTSPITTPDGGLPTWAQRSPRPPRTHPTGTHLPVGGPLPARPPAASPHADDRVSAVSTATESGTHQPSDRTGLGRSGPSGLSPTMLAVGIGAVLALIVVVVLILVVAG